MLNYLKLFAATDIKIWHGKSGKELGTVDTNQLKNNMADISPNGRFIAAAAFTADVKVCYVARLPPYLDSTFERQRAFRWPFYLVKFCFI